MKINEIDQKRPGNHQKLPALEKSSAARAERQRREKYFSGLISPAAGQPVAGAGREFDHLAGRHMQAGGAGLQRLQGLDVGSSMSFIATAGVKVLVTF